MSVMASGQATMKIRKPVPKEIAEILKNKRWFSISFTPSDCTVEFDGNWRLDDIIESVELLNPYIESGSINYWSDEGEARAEYDPEIEAWIEEWQEYYYMQDLPTPNISSNERIAEILDIIASDLMDCSGRSAAVELLINKCKLTPKEIKYYGLEWLKDLKK